ncbi:hypothetical protein [Alloalcanivorax marinus]|uniref:hypothetical protein n=1 Tax=Alloalcanivorax marinus TaxID=1177169 RepID=UPI001931DCBC|nr:hypothetical protein [Alloalcanivorax marinus]MBL7252031.1 hypothetical protein [Alloalcanivorax marinus]
MSRRGGKLPEWSHTKDGQFGFFSTDITVPIEYMLTTFGVNELSLLSYARDTQTALNFDLLMQRDIDEGRALAEISQYISPKEGGSKKDDIVFLPPLLAAIVPVTEDGSLSQYYPDCEESVGEDGHGEIYKRRWGRLFQVTHYDLDDGYPLALEVNGEKREVSIDPSKLTVEFSLASEGAAGAKLVVIDGQHRLFALKHLQKTCRGKIERILLPVCILYSPLSTKSKAADHIPSVPKVLRDLFVDVNSTVERVSGHFVILLSDQTLSSPICRAFCDEIMKKYDLGRQALSLVEWNTKNHKESLTISKSYTITSLGVIDEAFKAAFSDRDGRRLLAYMINLGEIEDRLDFGLDENDQPLPMPSEFPWRDFRYQNKPYLDECIRKHLVPNLIKIFFHSDPYRKHFEIFSRLFKTKLEDMAGERCPEAEHAKVVINHFLDSNPIYQNPSAESLKAAFISDVEREAAGSYPRIIRNNVFQRGMLSAWFGMISVGRRYQISIHAATDGFIRLLDRALSVKMGTFENDDKHYYLQESVYSGVKIRPTKEGRDQIQRLITAFLGNAKVCEEVVAIMSAEAGPDNVDALRDDLSNKGQADAAYFAHTLFSARRKAFVVSYKSDLQLSATEREKLALAQQALQDAKVRKKADSEIEIPTDFDDLVREHIKHDYDLSLKQLAHLLGFQPVAEEKVEEDVED